MNALDDCKKLWPKWHFAMYGTDILVSQTPLWFEDDVFRVSPAHSNFYLEIQHYIDRQQHKAIISSYLPPDYSDIMFKKLMEDYNKLSQSLVNQKDWNLYKANTNKKY